MTDNVSVEVYAIRPVMTDDGLLMHQIMVVDRATGARGTMLVSPIEGRELLGDCPTNDLVDIERGRIAWDADESTGS